MNGETVMLCKWWRTDSAQASIQRAANQRRERLEKFKQEQQQKKEQQHDDIWKEIRQ